MNRRVHAVQRPPGQLQEQGPVVAELKQLGISLQRNRGHRGWRAQRATIRRQRQPPFGPSKISKNQSPTIVGTGIDRTATSRAPRIPAQSHTHRKEQGAPRGIQAFGTKCYVPAIGKKRKSFERRTAPFFDRYAWASKRQERKVS